MTLEHTETLTTPRQRDYIFFADDRSGIPTSSMHIADQLVRTNRVFWVTLYTRLPKFSVSEFGKVRRILTHRKSSAAVNQQTAGQPIISAVPMQFPWFGKPGRIFNACCAVRFYKKFVREHNICNPVLITNFPCAADAFMAIRKTDPAAKQIYYCVDDYTEYPGLCPKHWANMEHDLFRTVDGAIFTSRYLQSVKKHPESLPDIYLPHGVDYHHFACAAADSGTGNKMLQKLAALPKPVIGFFGTIDTWTDISAIAYLAVRFPQCSFAVIARSVVPLTIFDGISNIHLLGQVPYAELPQYARCFDAGLIPRVQNALTKAMNPLKLMEYYAAGLPVIATKLPDIADVPGPLYFAETHEEFGSRLDEILRSDLPLLRRQAREVAERNSWAVRAEQFADFAENRC
ncbi:MAG: glycosyltransferase [Planctomycetaceae bacterium]|jgi:glycosyltransferase involved in cell wall biosynthesis|nr:glycosyltransferase [Planctomycetaceae bacterium]